MVRRKMLLGAAAVVAALGVLLVFAYAQAAESRAAERFDTTEVLVAQQRIAPGDSLSDALASGKVKLAPVPANVLLASATDSSDELDGEVALTTIHAGEQLIPERFGGADEIEAASVLPIPSGKAAVAVQVQADGRVGSFLRPGAEIAIVVTLLDDRRRPVVSRVLLERVTVLAHGTTTGSAATESAVEGVDRDVEQLITIAADQKAVEKIRFAERAGILSAALLNDASKIAADEGITAENLFD
jgi:pilus assembly protein CpaB